MSEESTSRALDQDALNEEASKELEALVAAEEAAQGGRWHQPARWPPPLTATHRQLTGPAFGWTE